MRSKSFGFHSFNFSVCLKHFRIKYICQKNHTGRRSRPWIEFRPYCGENPHSFPEISWCWLPELVHGQIRHLFFKWAIIEMSTDEPWEARACKMWWLHINTLATWGHSSPFIFNRCFRKEHLLFCGAREQPTCCNSILPINASSKHPFTDLLQPHTQWTCLLVG